MMLEEYKDEAGNTQLLVSSNVPGLSIVPPGMNVTDAAPITIKQYEVKQKAMVKKADAVRPPSMEERMQKMQARLDQLESVKPVDPTTQKVKIPIMVEGKE